MSRSPIVSGPYGGNLSEFVVPSSEEPGFATPCPFVRIEMQGEAGVIPGLYGNAPDAFRPVVERWFSAHATEICRYVVEQEAQRYADALAMSEGSMYCGYQNNEEPQSCHRPKGHAGDHSEFPLSTDSQPGFAKPYPQVRIEMPAVKYATVEDLEIRAEAVETLEQAYHLANIRNACREGFAHDNEPISAQRQRAWWVAMKGRIKPWIYRDWIGFSVGYGMLRQTEDGRWWSSVAVLPEVAGKGYGGAITADLIRRVDHVVYAEARKDNPAAMRLHRAADWEVVGEDERLMHYRSRPVSYATPGDYPPDVIAAFTERNWSWA